MIMILAKHPNNYSEQDMFEFSPHVAVLGPDTKSLTRPPVVQLVVFFAELWVAVFIGLSNSIFLCFIIVINLIIVFYFFIYFILFFFFFFNMMCRLSQGAKVRAEHFVYFVSRITSGPRVNIC